MKNRLNLLNFKAWSGLWFQSLPVRVRSATPLNSRKFRRYRQFSQDESFFGVSIISLDFLLFLYFYLCFTPKSDPNFISSVKLIFVIIINSTVGIKAPAAQIDHAGRQFLFEEKLMLKQLSEESNARSNGKK